MTYQTVIYQKVDDEVVEVITSGVSERTAQRVANGVEINLDHDEYYVEVEQD